MRRHCELIAILVAGCNPVFGLEATQLVDGGGGVDDVPPDRDRDGILDRDDPCIAGVADYMTDLDSDRLPNVEDSCPLDLYDALDQDNDDVLDNCDPLYMIGGERQRCFMAFLNPTINRELWTARGDPTVWNMLDRIEGDGTGLLVAGERFEGPATTEYGLALSVSPTGANGAVTLWLRANESGPGGVGCELRYEGTRVSLTILGSGPLATVDIPIQVEFVSKLIAVMIPNAAGTNMRCELRDITTGPYGYTLNGQAVLPEGGRIALGVENVMVNFWALHVFERDEPPAL